jgi:hypothetical protein
MLDDGDSLTHCNDIKLKHKILSPRLLHLNFATPMSVKFRFKEFYHAFILVFTYNNIIEGPLSSLDQLQRPEPHYLDTQGTFRSVRTPMRPMLPDGLNIRTYVSQHQLTNFSTTNSSSPHWPFWRPNPLFFTPP